MSRQGVLEEVTRQKKKEQMLTGRMKAEQFGITQPKEVFLRLSEVFDCASWEIVSDSSGFSAEARACKLCALAKKVGALSPCGLYCLDPMEGMVKGLDAGLSFAVRDTLWDGLKCRVEVR